MKDFFSNLRYYMRPILLYLTYFCMVGGIASMMTYDGDGDVFSCPGFIVMLVGMFAFWITFFALKFFDWFDEAEFMSRKTAIRVGFAAAGLLLLLQLYIRAAYSHYGFFTLPITIPDFENLLAYQGWIYTVRHILVCVMGFAFFSLRFADGDDVGYRFVEVTTYFDDSGMEMDKKVSGEQYAVWGYIVLGLLTTVLPYLVSLTPVMILVFAYFALRMRAQRSKRTVNVKRAVTYVIFGLVTVVSLLFTLRIPMPFTIPEPAVFHYEWEYEDGELTCVAAAVLNESTATSVNAPERFLFWDIEYASSTFKNCDKIEKVRVPFYLLRAFPTAKEIILTSSGEVIPSINEGVKMAADRIIFDFEIGDSRFSLKGLDGFTPDIVQLPNDLEAYDIDPSIDFADMWGTPYGGGYYIGSEENPYMILTRVSPTEEFTIHPDTIAIGAHVFDGVGQYVGQKQIVSVDLSPATGLAQIGDQAFRDCRQLESITLPASLTKIGKYAFLDCVALTSITLPEGVESLSEGCFKGCTALSSVTLLGDVFAVSKETFHSCRAFGRFVLPSTLRVFHYRAFHDANVQLYYEGTAEDWAKVYIGEQPWNAPDITPKFYSETYAAGCWHYGADGEVLDW